MVVNKRNMRRHAPLMTYGHQTPADIKGFTFCIVRNPYDRAVSLYWHYKRRKRYRHTFPYFLQTLQSGIDPAGLWNVRGFSQANSQTDWFQPGIDYVGRFEKLQESYDFICDKLNIPRHTVPHKNSGNHVDWQTFYNQKTARLVEKFYAKDFEIIGYEKGTF